MNKKPRILVVENNVAFSSVVRLNLQRADFEVEVAANGRLALGVIDAQPPFDLIVTDQQMPELCGLDLCKQLRALKEYRDVPVILLTAKRLEVDVEKITGEYGLSAVYAKPFSPTKLVRHIQDLLAPV